jgi:osmotically inducible protein OsmC
VKATGSRDGRAVSSDGVLDVRLTTPRALGGAGGRGTNPEQLFAAGYEASFLSAMQYVAARDTLAIPPETAVEGTVGVGTIPAGFGLVGRKLIHRLGACSRDLMIVVMPEIAAQIPR